MTTFSQAFRDTIEGRIRWGDKEAEKFARPIIRTLCKHWPLTALKFSQLENHPRIVSLISAIIKEKSLIFPNQFFDDTDFEVDDVKISNEVKTILMNQYDLGDWDDFYELNREEIEAFQKEYDDQKHVTRRKTRKG